jgi:hypothetical protein
MKTRGMAGAGSAFEAEQVAVQSAISAAAETLPPVEKSAEDLQQTDAARWPFPEGVRPEDFEPLYNQE